MTLLPFEKQQHLRQMVQNSVRSVDVPNSYHCEMLPGQKVRFSALAWINKLLDGRFSAYLGILSHTGPSFPGPARTNSIKAERATLRASIKF
jgi:hypothetical protein